MAQIKRFKWVNETPVAPRNLDVGFTGSTIEIFNLSTPAALYWTLDMGQDSVFNVGVPAFITSNGVTLLSQDSTFGANVSGFTNAAPGVLTVNDTATFGFAVGDTIKVASLADDGSGTNSLNSEFTIASFTATAITLVEDTSVTGFSVYVSGGIVTRVSDINGVAIPTENFAIEGLTLGTSAVGGDAESMVAVVYGENVVV